MPKPRALPHALTLVPHAHALAHARALYVLTRWRRRHPSRASSFGGDGVVVGSGSGTVAYGLRVVCAILTLLRWEGPWGTYASASLRVRLPLPGVACVSAGGGMVMVW